MEALQVPPAIPAKPVQAEESWPVPPLALANVPPMEDRVVVPVQIGMPFPRARTNPSVELAARERTVGEEA